MASRFGRTKGREENVFVSYHGDDNRWLFFHSRYNIDYNLFGCTLKITRK